MHKLRDRYIRLAGAMLVIALSHTNISPRVVGVTPERPTGQQPVPQVPRPAPQPVPQVPSPAQPPLQPAPRMAPSKEQFTQTEGYLQVPKLRAAVTKEFTGSAEVVKHMDIVSRVMAKEAELRNTHWAFYHGISNVWTVWQDTYTELFSHFNPSVQLEDADFIFLRTRGKESRKAKDFLVGSLRKDGLVDDNGDAKAILLSTNLSLFGNTGRSSECTWDYMMAKKSHEAPVREMYESIMDEFGLPHTYIDELMKLVDLLRTRQQTLLQIFVPKNIVDDIGYLAWIMGMPAHQPSMDWVINSRITKQAGKLKGLAALRDTFKKEQEKNPLFREMLETVEKGGYSLDAYLKRYCNEPLKLSNLNNVQARLIFTDDILLNPASGVKMFRHTAVEPKQMKDYKTRFDAIIKKILAAKGR